MDLRWVMFGGGWGTQLMAVTKEDANYVWGYKYRAQSGRWTGKVRLARALVRGPAAGADPRGLGSTGWRRALASLPAGVARG